MMWKLDITREGLEPIIAYLEGDANGKKYEIRVPDHSPQKQYWNIKPGDILEFYIVDEHYQRISETPAAAAKAVKITKFDSVTQAWNSLPDPQRLNPGFSLSDMIDLLNSFPRYPERMMLYGLIVIELGPISSAQRQSQTLSGCQSQHQQPSRS